MGNADASPIQKNMGKRDSIAAPYIFEESSDSSPLCTALYSYFLSRCIPISPKAIAPPYKVKKDTDSIMGKACPSNIFR